MNFFGLATKTYELHPSILRVNRLIYDEASEILLEKNPWILFTINWTGSVAAFRPSGAPQSELDGFPACSTRNLLAFNGTTALRIDIRDRNRRPEATEVVLFVNRDYLFMVFNDLTMNHTTSDLRLHIQFKPTKHDQSPTKYDQSPTTYDQRVDQEDLARTLLDIQGVGATTVENADPPDLGVNLASAMMASFAGFDEITETYDRRIREYDTRGDRQVVDEAYEDAFHSFLRCQLYVKGIARRIEKEHLERDNVLIQCLVHPMHLRVMMLCKQAYCRINQDLLSEAWEYLQVAETSSTDLLEDRAVTCYLQALVNEAWGQHYEAFYRLMVALVKAPSNYHVNMKLDAVEAQLRENNDWILEDTMTERLASMRHNTATQLVGLVSTNYTLECLEEFLKEKSRLPKGL